ncbi:MAG: caspase family protein [Cyanobacteriota bacterium]
MRTLLLLLCVSLLSLSWNQCTYAKETDTNSYALIIGINYQNDNNYLGESPINGAKLMKKLIVDKYKFDPINIMTLIEGEPQSINPTKKEIVASLERLISKVKPQDKVFIYYAGHGVRINDDNNDEKDDNYDEAIVPCDYKTKDSYEVINDDDLSWFINRINSDNITIIFDCCHSGTGNRLPQSNYNKVGEKFKLTRSINDIFIMDYKPLRKNSIDSTSTTESSSYDLGSNYIFFAAAQDDEEASNGGTPITIDGNEIYCGSFTSALYRTLLSTHKNSAWKETISNIDNKTLIDNPYQNPKFFGNTNKIIFSSEEKVSNVPIKESSKESFIKYKTIKPDIYIDSNDEKIRKKTIKLLENNYNIIKDKKKSCYSHHIQIIKEENGYNLTFLYYPESENKFIKKTFNNQFQLENFLKTISNKLYNFINLVSLSNNNSKIKLEVNYEKQEKKVYAYLKAKEDCYLTILRIDGAFNITLIPLSDNFLQSGDIKKVVIDLDSDFTNGLSNRKYIKIIATEKPVNISNNLNILSIVQSLTSSYNKNFKNTTTLLPLSTWDEKLLLF